jgi:hypothetical protein
MDLALTLKKNGKTFCVICGYKTSKGALEIHHCDGNHSNNDSGNLIVLCRLCHVEAHEKRRQRAPNTLLLEYDQTNSRNKNTTNTKKTMSCHHCGYTWEYGGNATFYLTCPKCLGKIKNKPSF